MKKYTIYMWCFLFLLSGCGDFLEEQSQDLKYAVNCADLEELLVGGAYATQRTMTGSTLSSAMLSSSTNGLYMLGLHVMDDDVNEWVTGVAPTVSTHPYSLLGAFYSWAANPCYNGSSEYDDPTWISLYTHIGVTNAVLAKVDEFIEETEAARNSVKGQACFLRAYYYYFLVNLYAKPYSAITASSDLGVPLKTFAHIDDRYWGRTSIDSVYSQIVHDLQTSIACLSGIEPKNLYWAGEDAARVLLSRVYCYMGKWELVPELCEPLFHKKYALADITTNLTNPYISIQSPELIFTMGMGNRKYVFRTGTDGSTISTFQVSEDLKKMYGIGDKRPNVRFGNLSYGSEKYPQPMDDFVSDVFTMRLSEVYLNQAEALAMTGDEDGARELIRELQKKRIVPENVGSITESGEKLIKLIREERRKELCFEGHRWFDLRRYAVCSNYPESKEIRHEHYTHTTGTIYQFGEYAGYYLLDGYPAKNWVLPIPQFEIEENHGELINNERSESTLY